jgi:hypothetical protein
MLRFVPLDIGFPFSLEFLVSVRFRSAMYRLTANVSNRLTFLAICVSLVLYLSWVSLLLPFRWSFYEFLDG